MAMLSEGRRAPGRATQSRQRTTSSRCQLAGESAVSGPILQIRRLICAARGDVSEFTSDEPVDLAACVGATWIGGGVAGTIDLLGRSLRPGGMLLIGEPYWRKVPPNDEVARACDGSGIDDFATLPGLVKQFGELGFDVVEMVLADQDSWDRYMAPQWFNLRRWLDANPDDELAAEVRRILTTGPAN